MKHTCLLFVGDVFSAVSKGISKYVLKYGKGEVPAYLSVMQLKESSNGYEILVAEPTISLYLLIERCPNFLISSFFKSG